MKEFIGLCCPVLNSLLLKLSMMSTMMRKVVGLAIDTPSTDRGQSRTFSTHQVLGEANVWGLENLANSDQLPSKGFMIYNMVHKLEGGSGGPTRVVAVLNKDHAGSGGRVKGGSISFIFIVFVLVLIY